MAALRFRFGFHPSFSQSFALRRFFNLIPQIAKRFVDSFGRTSRHYLFLLWFLIFIFHFTFIDLPIFK